MFSLNTWGMMELLFARLVRDKKLYLVILMLIAILDEYTGSARNVIMQYNIHVNAWGSFACLTSYSFLMLWIVAGYLILVSDAPFITELSIYECVRITPWQSISARLIYIIVVSISYVIMIFILSSLIQLASFIEIEKWDKALYTMSRGQMVADSFLYIPSVIVSAYTPIAAWFMAVGLLILALTLLGVAMFFSPSFLIVKLQFAWSVYGLHLTSQLAI